MNISLHLFKVFFRNGWLAVGNSYAALPSVEDELVGAGYLTREDFADSVAVAQALPGLFSLNLSAHVGYRLRGIGGGAAALAGAVLPAFLSLLVLATFFFRWREAAGMGAFLRGMRPAVVALMAWAAWRAGRTAGIDLSNLWLPVVALVTIGVAGISPAYILVAAVFGGFLYGVFLRPADEPVRPAEPRAGEEEASPPRGES